MIRTFLRAPRGAGELVADACRLLGVLSLVAVLIGWPLVDVAVFALALLGLLVPRFLGIRPGLDIPFCLAVLAAAWSAVLDLYNAIAYLDFAVHLVFNGLMAAVLYVLAVRVGVLPDPAETSVTRGAIVALTLAFGLSAGVFWELGEWAGHTYIDDAIFVGYADTIGDLVAGGLGSIGAGLFGRSLVDESRYIPAPVLQAAHK